MPALVAWLSGSRIGRALAGVVVFLGGILAAWLIGRREGRRGAETRAKLEDYENADEIRHRADDALRRFDGDPDGVLNSPGRRDRD